MNTIRTALSLGFLAAGLVGASVAACSSSADGSSGTAGGQSGQTGGSNAPGTGGGNASGGGYGTDGGTGTGGADGGTAADGATPATGEMDSNVVVDGYVMADPWKGYGFTATDPGAATITPDCSTGTACTPPYVGAAFCMKGTVTGRTDYSGFAMLGWSINQGNTAGDTPQDWIVPASGGITITVANPGKTQLRVQLQGADPHSATDRWCAPLVSGKMIPWTSFKTNCWTGGTPQTPLAAGTPLQQAAITVPGTQKDLPFDVCLVDIKIE